MKKEEAKTCEERVLAEIGELEEKIGGLTEENEKLQQTVKYADTVLGILKQICVLEDVEGDDKSMVFRGVYKFDKVEDAQLIELLGIFVRKEEEKKVGEKGDDVKGK